MTVKKSSQPGIPRWLGLTALLIFALVIRIERAFLTTVVNPDAMRFIAQGREFFINPLGAVRQEVYHPLQSILGTLIHNIVMVRLVADRRMAWIYSMQALGVVAGALIAIEIFWLSRRFGAPRWAAYCVSIIWVLGRKTGAYGADGISDMLFLSLLGLSILTAMKTGLRCRPWYWFAAGIFSGFSYLTRPEGVAAVLIMLWALAIYHGAAIFSSGAVKAVDSPIPFNKRRGLVPALVSAAMLIAGYLIVGLPYMLSIGAFTRKKKLELMRAHSISHPQLSHLFKPLPTIGHPDLAFIGPSAFFHPWMWMKIGQEIFETLSPAACIVLLLAMALAPRIWGRRRWRPAVLGWAALWFTVMIWLLNIAGYLHGRHTLVLVLLLLPILALGLDRVVHRWGELLRTSKRPDALRRLPQPLRDAAHANRMGILLTAVICIPGMVHLADAPQRGMRFIEDGARWLKTNARSKVIVNIGIGDDRRALVAYYSGLDYMFCPTPPTAQTRRQMMNLSNNRPVLLDEVFQGKQAKRIPAFLGPYHVMKLRGRVVKFRARHTLGANVLVFYVLPHQRVLKSAAKMPDGRLP
ncbi:MAG: hypothetical protein ACP5O1_04900 [Phycisphaerae bacterium]